MCGIAGLYDPKGIAKDEALYIAKKVGDSLEHRGPDHFGYWINCEDGVLLIHRRLSIIDLSESGNQPMVSSSGRYVIVLNGEIYNHLELREELEKDGAKCNWKGHSDTETLLHAIDTWGFESAINKIVGMFAFALWDKVDRRLILARDRMGEKPLYYGWQNNRFFFCSELKALMVNPLFERTINRKALPLYLKYNYIPAPFSILNNIYKLPPASFLIVSDKRKHESPKIYWSLKEKIINNIFVPVNKKEVDIVQELEILIKNSLKLQMAADVPVGAMLSGGVDSSLLVSILQSISNKPIKTFTVGFLESEFNEAEKAAQIANYLKTDHHELILTYKEALTNLEKIINAFDEPFADSSQIPTYLITQYMRKRVKVAISGDGGDELFGGYNRHFMLMYLMSVKKKIPFFLQKYIKKLLVITPANLFDNLARVAPFLLPEALRIGGAGYKMQKFLKILDQSLSFEVYELLRTYIDHPERFLISHEFPEIDNVKIDDFSELDNIIMKIMYKDMTTYLPDDILVKVDRASMANSLEVRAPYLDHRIVEYSWNIPIDLKIKGKINKWILRQILYKYLPKKFVLKQKSGFGIPLGNWLRSNLRSWAEELIREEKIKREKIFNYPEIKRLWQMHKSGKAALEHQLWTILIFQCWLNKYKNEISI